MIGRRHALAIIGGGVGLSSLAGVTAQEHDPAAHEPDPDGPEIADLSHEPASGPIIPATEITLTASAHDPQGRLEAVVFAEGRNYTRVASVPVGGGSDVATYAYDEAPRHMRSGYPCIAWAVSEDGRAGEQVRVDGPEIAVPVRAQFVSINDPVAAGDRLEATVSVEHIGSFEDVGPVPDLHLIVGDEVVDSRSLDLEWNETIELALGYDTYPVRRDVSFDVWLVAGETVADTRTVSVYA